MTENTFKVGDKVRITNDNRYAYVKVGDIATVTCVEDHGCMLRCGPISLREHESNKSGYHYFFSEGKFELVEEEYNLDQMYPWSGGECPVHPETGVKYWMRLGNREGYTGTAKNLRWNNSRYSFTNDIVAFKVIKEYVEPPKPIEGYVNVHHDGSTSFFNNKGSAEMYATRGDTRIAVHLKEV